MTEAPPAALSATQRLGCSLAFVRLHWAPHTCLDSRHYTTPCLITDPTRELTLLGLLTPKENS